MSELAGIFVRKSCSLLATEYLPKIERSIERLSEDLIWRRANDASNSVGNLMLHLRGNVLCRGEEALELFDEDGFEILAIDAFFTASAAV